MPEVTKGVLDTVRTLWPMALFALGVASEFIRRRFQIKGLEERVSALEAGHQTIVKDLHEIKVGQSNRDQALALLQSTQEHQRVLTEELLTVVKEQGKQLQSVATSVAYIRGELSARKPQE